ncbi:zinc-binding protein A33-like [Carcharodon carcharias]|uniref:zinc-binding protein A33-like n=1 Tax=Carcharodon carcharias TaxID=13397 RepID=UPI001B7DB109|nr:zinc-binding protein A33-like [Carcharodon carcharias]
MADSLNADLSCPICIDFFIEPVSLECGHNFCRDCILNAWAQSDHASRNSCPQCRRESGWLDIRSNRLLASIVEGFQRLWHSEPAAPELSLKCHLHQQDIGLFCSDDLQLICRACWRSEEHRNHGCTAIKNAYKVCKANSIQLLQDKLKQYRDTHTATGLKISETLEHTNRLQDQITAEFAELQHFLQQREQDLIQRLRATAESAINQLVENMALISKRSALVEQALEDIQSMQEKTQLLMEIKGILQRCDLETNPALKTPKLNLGEFNGPLQYTVWKQMLNIISPAPAPLTLDSESASLDLVLSKDHTMVKGRSKLKAFPHNPKRFSNYGCVLAQEGFTSGKHYWEVSVESIDEWIVGAAKESIDRHSTIELTPSNGFWILRKWNGNIYGPHHAKESECHQNMNLQKVGICVDYEGGQVSFYNADDMTHLYTSTDRFTEKIYPFFLPFLESVTKEVLKVFHLKL